MCHLYRDLSDASREPARDGSSPRHLRPRHVLVAAAGVAVASAAAAVLWFGDTSPDVMASRVADVPLPAALARAGGSAEATTVVPQATPVSIDQAGVGHDDGVPSDRAARAAGGECSHGM